MSNPNLALVRARSRLVNQGNQPSAFIDRHLKQRLCWLAANLPSTLIGGYILLNVYPHQMQHLLAPNTYAPVLFICWWWLLSLGQVISLHLRRSVLVASGITVLLFLRLARVVLSPTVLVGIFLILFAIECLYLMSTRIRQRLRKKDHERNPIIPTVRI